MSARPVSAERVPAAVPMVLIPALLCDDAMYRGMLAGLGESVDARVRVAPHPVVATSIAEILAHAPARFVLLGSSYGGTIAIEVALAAPDRVMALCLVGCDPGASDRERSLGIAAMIEATPAAAAAHLATVVVRSQATGAVTTFLAMAQRVGGAVGGAQMRALGARDDAWDRLTTLGMPVLVLWGADDAAIPVAVGERIAATLPDAERHVLAACGHLPTLEEPAETARLVSEWMARVVPAM